MILHMLTQSKCTFHNHLFPRGSSSTNKLSWRNVHQNSALGHSSILVHQAPEFAPSCEVLNEALMDHYHHSVNSWVERISMIRIIYNRYRWFRRTRSWGMGWGEGGRRNFVKVSHPNELVSKPSNSLRAIVRFSTKNRRSPLWQGKSEVRMQYKILYFSGSLNFREKKNEIFWR